jgi:hypothetical protein
MTMIRIRPMVLIIPRNVFSGLAAITKLCCLSKRPKSFYDLTFRFAHKFLSKATARLTR